MRGAIRTTIKSRADAAQNLADQPRGGIPETLSGTVKSGTTLPGTNPAAGLTAT